MAVRPDLSDLYDDPVARRISIKDVAVAAGVSPTTVSDALSGKGRLPAATRELVRKHARELGYTPSSTARSLVAGRSGILLMSVGTADLENAAMWDVEFFVRVMSSASTVALNAGYALALSPADPHGLRSEISFDGAIVVDPVPGNYVVDRAIQASRPLVTIGHLDGVSSTIIDNDFETAVRGVLDHFWANGARRPALVSSPIDASYATRCVAEYERWCAEHHLPAQVVVTKSGLSDESGRLAALDLLAQPEPPDAVFATLDRLALGVVAGAQQSNVDIPRDLMVAGLGDSEAAAHHRIPISSVDLEPTMLGRLAAEALIRRIETHEIPPNRTVPSTLIVRASSTRSQ